MGVDAERYRRIVRMEEYISPDASPWTARAR